MTTLCFTIFLKRRIIFPYFQEQRRCDHFYTTIARLFTIILLISFYNSRDNKVYITIQEFFAILSENVRYIGGFPHCYTSRRSTLLIKPKVCSIVLEACPAPPRDHVLLTVHKCMVKKDSDALSHFPGLREFRTLFTYTACEHDGGLWQISSKLLVNLTHT